MKATLKIKNPHIWGDTVTWSASDSKQFGAWDQKRGCESLGLNILHPKTLVVGGILADESSQLIRHFFEQKRR